MPITPSSLVGSFDAVTDRLTPVPPGQRRTMLDLPLTRRAHADAHATAPAFRQVESGGTAARAGSLPASCALPPGTWSAACIPTSRHACCGSTMSVWRC